MRAAPAPRSRPLLTALLVALLVALVAPAALADHMWSHRVYVVGRVVDADGMPAPGLPVNVTFGNLSVVGGCYDAKEETTGPRGDYTICRHAHAIASDARAIVHVGGATREVSIDPDLRHAVASFRLMAPRSVRDFEGDIEFARSIDVNGRAFALLPQSVNSETVLVNATPLLGNVTVELRAAGETVASRNVTLGEFGLYSAQLDADPLPPGAVVHVRLGPDASDAPVDPTFRRLDLNLVRDLRLISGPGEDAPGSDTPLGLWPALVALLVAIACAGRRGRPRRSRGRGS